MKKKTETKEAVRLVRNRDAEVQTGSEIRPATHRKDAFAFQPASDRAGYRAAMRAITTVRTPSTRSERSGRIHRACSEVHDTPSQRSG